jgi:hypothetical protein
MTIYQRYRFAREVQAALGEALEHTPPERFTDADMERIHRMAEFFRSWMKNRVTSGVLDQLGVQQCLRAWGMAAAEFQDLVDRMRLLPDLVKRVARGY